MTWIRNLTSRRSAGPAASRVAAIGALVALAMAASAYVALIAVGIADRVLSGGVS